MQNKLIICQGIPGCGKTTWAVDYQSDNPGVYISERDVIRKTLFGWQKGDGRLTQEQEELVTAYQNIEIVKWLEYGHTVIVSDTNIQYRYYKRFIEMANKIGVPYEMKIFDTPLDVCLERNNTRPEAERVPEVVIRKMNKRLKNKKHFKNYDRPFMVSADKTPAFIFDMDGTMRVMNDRSAFDSKAAYKDYPNAPVAIVVAGLAAAYPGATFIALSGATDDSIQVVIDQLESWGVTVDGIFMRKTGDHRKDSVIKEEIYREKIEPYFNVVCVFDDRDQVVEMWRSLGLHCFQVAAGNF